MQVLTQDRLFSLVGRIYDAAAEPPLWSVFLKEFVDIVNAEMASLLYYDLECGKAKLAVSFGWDPDCVKQYSGYYSAINPWINAWKTNLNRAGPETVETSDQRTPFAQLKKTEFYNDYLINQNMAHQVGCMMTKTEESCSAFTCVRSRMRGPFRPPEVELLRCLFPHLQRAIQFHKRIAEWQGYYHISLDALDHLATGVILMDDRGQILETNHAARQILSQNDGLTTEREGLAASTSNQTRELRSSIAAAALTARGKGLSSGGSLTIVRPSGKRSFALVIMPASVQAFRLRREDPL